MMDKQKLKIGLELLEQLLSDLEGADSLELPEEEVPELPVDEGIVVAVEETPAADLEMLPDDKKKKDEEEEEEY